MTGLGPDVETLDEDVFGGTEVNITAQETEQDPNALNDDTYQGYLGDGVYVD